MDVEVRSDKGVVLCRGTYDGPWLHDGLKFTNTEDIGPLDVIEYGDPRVLIAGDARAEIVASSVWPKDTLTVRAGDCTFETAAGMLDGSSEN